MNMKKISIVFLVFLSFAVVIWRFAFSHQGKAGSYSRNDTIYVNQLRDSAKLISQNNPDSSILLYKKAISILENIKESKSIRHLLATTYVDLSYLYLPKADYEKARNLIRKSTILSKNKDNDVNVRSMIVNGMIYTRLGQLDSAIVQYDNAEALAKKINNKKYIAKILSNKAIINSMQGENSVAESMFKKALQLGLETNDKEMISGSYLNLGVVSMNAGKYQQAKDFYTKATDYYKRNNIKEDLILGYQNLGNINYYMEKYSDAIEMYQQSLLIAKELGNKQGIAKGYHNIGEVYVIIGDKEQAIEAFMQSLKIKESIGDPASLSSGYRSLGDLNFDQRNYDKSLKYYQLSLAIDLRLKLVSGLAKDYAGMAAVYGETGRQKKVEEFSKKAISAYTRMNDLHGVSEINSMLGSFYFRKNDFTRSLEFYQKALEQKLNLSNDQEGLSSLYNQLSELYLRIYKVKDKNRQNLLLSVSYGLKSYEIADKLGIPYLIGYSSRNLSMAYKELNNYPKAFHFLEINKYYSDSLYSKSKAEALVFAEARWNSEKKQQEIHSLEKLNKAIYAQKTAEGKRHNTILIGLGSVFILIALSVILFLMNLRKRHEIEYQQQLSRIHLLRLQNIRNRISPHFIFNVLNREISSGIGKTKRQEMAGLVDFLRRSLEITEQISVTLAEELDFVRNYLKIEQAGLGDDFHVEWNIPDMTDLNRWKIPAMIIQIPVENALKHALRPKEGQKQLTITVFEQGNFLNIEILDNGDGYHPENIVTTHGTGTGLKVLYQTVQMLNSKNKKKMTFSISDRAESGINGTRVSVAVPEGFQFEIS